MDIKKNESDRVIVTHLKRTVCDKRDGLVSWNSSSSKRTFSQCVFWKQDPEANIWFQERWEWGVKKAPQWGTS